jgi:tetratricopeptide (TPR) repeat protein
MVRRMLVRSARVACLLAVLGGASAARPALADDNRTQALALFEDGKKAYLEGRFEEAVKLLERAHQLHPEPVLLYNLARAREGLGQFDTAVVAYEQYLREAGNIPDRGAIEAKVANLKRDLEEKRRLAAERDAAMRLPEPPQKPVDQPKPDSGAGPSPWPWVIAGVGAAGLAVGGALGGVALAKNSDAEAASVQADAFALRSDAEDLALGSTIAFIAGGAVLAGGFVWGIVDLTSGGSKEPAPAAARLWVGPTRVGFSASF